MAFEFVENILIELPDVDDQLSAFSEQDYKKEHGLIIEVAAIHEGITRNFNFYPQKTLSESLSTWVHPYPKPILINHDLRSEPIGRVMAAKMETEAETPYVKLQMAITDPEAVRKVLDQRYLTGSVGGSAEKVTCSVCNADWSEASITNIPCRHRRGKVYQGKMAYMEMHEVKFKEYSFVNAPADENSSVMGISTTSKEDREEDGWVRSAKVFSLDMAKEEIVEFSESHDDRNVLEGLKRKEAAPIYMSLKGAFLSAMAMAESDEEEKDSKKPYGDVKYADPGYQDDGKKRYPLDTEDHVRSAWSYINQKKNASKYTAEQLKQIKGRIRSAAKKFGITLNEDDKSVHANNKESDVSKELVNEEEDILDVTDSLSSDLNQPEAQEEEVEEEEIEEEVEEASDEVSEEEQEEVEASEEEEADEEEEVVAEADSEEEAAETDLEEEASEEEAEETDLNESVETLESRVEELESREQTLLEEKETLTNENTRLKAALKRSLAERVVDAKIALGLLEQSTREEQLEEHVSRSASSLADSIRDLASMPIQKNQSENLHSAPTVEEESAAVLGNEDSVVTEGEEKDGDSHEEKVIDPEEGLYNLINGAFKN